MFHQALALAYLAARRYAEGLSWADRAVRGNGGAVALRLKLSLCGHLERLEEARECLRLLREVDPEPTMAAVRRLGWGSPQLTQCFVEGLCKAGMPEE